MPRPNRQRKRPPRPVRTAARALVIEEGRLLAIRMQDGASDFFILPGGGQRSGETLEDTVRRECLEELGIEVIPERFAYIREYIGKNHGFSHIHSGFHQLEVVFFARLAGSMPGNHGHETDRKQVGWAWIPLADLPHVAFYPKDILRGFRNGSFSPEAPYLGDVN